jgi:hypothetical protein
MEKVIMKDLVLKPSLVLLSIDIFFTISYDDFYSKNHPPILVNMICLSPLGMEMAWER